MGATATAVKQLETLLREHRWGKVLDLLATGLSVRQLRRGLDSVIAGRQSEVLAALLAAGADANRDHALYHAVRARWQPGVELLLGHGADPGYGPTLESPLMAAIARRDDRLGALLVRRGAPLLDVLTRRPLMLRAAHLGLAETVRAMLEVGADPNTRGRLARAMEIDGTLHDTIHPLFADAPALVIAAATGRAAVVEVIAGSGADLAAHDDEGRTALAAARQGGHAAVAAYLEALGAPEAARRSPAEQLFAAIEAGDLATVERLLASGVSADTADPRGASRGRPPLAAAVIAGLPELLDLLLARGADVDRRDSDEERRLTVLGVARPADVGRETHRRGMTPLMYAALLDRADCARRLLAAGARTDLLDHTRHSALMLAAGNGHAATVEVLLAAGADPNVRGAERMTALHLAAADNHTAAALALVRAGADAHLREASGDTPAAMARLLDNRPLLAAIAEAAAARPRRRRERPKATPAAAAVKPPAAAPAGDTAAGEREAARSRCRAAAGDAFLAAASDLAARLGVAVDDRRAEEGAVEMHAPTTAELDLPALQAELLGRAAFLFASEHVAGLPTRLTLLPTADPLEAVAFVGVGGSERGTANADVATWLASLREPWQVTVITHDTLAGRFLAPPADPVAAAEAIFRVCPDAVHQGAGDVESLAAELAATGRFFLWWD